MALLKGDPQDLNWFLGLAADFWPRFLAVTQNGCSYLSGHGTGKPIESYRLIDVERLCWRLCADNVWVLQEAVIPYGQKTGVKNASKAVN